MVVVPVAQPLPCAEADTWVSLTTSLDPEKARNRSLGSPEGVLAQPEVRKGFLEEVTPLEERGGGRWSQSLQESSW